MKRFLPILIVLVCVFTFVQSGAQSLAVTGVVKDEQGNTLPGVSIQIKGTTRGTVTDGNGSFAIENLNAESRLVFSFIGFLSQEILVGNQTTLTVTLAEDVETLEEVVVVGYGTVKKSDLTGSVSSVKGNDLIKIPANNPVQALQGKVAGVQVSSISGAPGAGVSVRVRGTGTFNNAAPIFVVDGVILDDISFLNASDIQSMEVLKDASSTAIYGSRGANGVILVTTKKGKSGNEAPVINVSADFSVQRLAKKIDLLNGKQFATIYNEISPGRFNNVDAVPNTDWQDLIFRDAPMQNMQISATGGSAKSQYFVSFGYFNQEGIIPKSGYERISIRFNNTYHLSDKIRLGNNITFAPERIQNAPNVVFSVYRAQPTSVPFYLTGPLAGQYGAVPNVGNPLADIEYNNSTFKRFRTVSNVFGEWDIIKGLTVKSSFSVDLNFGRSRNFSPAYTIFNDDGTATPQQNVFSDVSKGSTDNAQWLLENTINYNKEIGKNRFGVLAGYTMQSTSNETIRLSGENLQRDNSDFWYIRPSYVYDESNGINRIGSIENSVDANNFYNMISYLFRGNYTYDDKYLLTLTYRIDGTSTFPEANRYASFPSVAVGWNVINESFMAPISFLSDLKLRASYGSVGNQRIAYLDQFSVVDSELNPVFGPDESLNPGSSFGKPGNVNLKWETTYQTDFGIEASLFDNRFRAEIDYYNKETRDILVPLSIPGHLGAGQGVKVTYNAGTLYNRGVEFDFSWTQEFKDLKIKAGVLGATVKNRVKSVNGGIGVDSTLAGPFYNNNPVTLTRAGLPVGAFFGYKTNGVFQSQAELDAYPHSAQAGVGDLRFVDINNDGVINAADRTYLGSPIPTFTYGFNLEITYKNFELGLDFQGQYGNKIFNAKEVVRPDPYNFEARAFDRWTPDNPSNTVPRSSFGGYNYTPSDYFIQDGSFFRLRNASIAYNVPSVIASKLRMKSARVVLRGTNIFTASRFTGYSPEIGSANVLESNIDTGIYPITSIYTLGLNATF